MENTSINSKKMHITMRARKGTVKDGWCISTNEAYVKKLVCVYAAIGPCELSGNSTEHNRWSNSTNYDSLISHNASVHDHERELSLRSWGMYPSRATLLNHISYYREGHKMQLKMTGSLTGYTDFYNLSCISNLYPISLTQNELVNFPVDDLFEIVQETNKVLKEYKQKPLVMTDMIDHRLYRNDILCIVINKTYGLDKRKVNEKEIECLSALLTGFCTIDALNFQNEVVSQICGCIEKIIKNANLNSNTALKYQKDIRLSDDNIKVLTGKKGEYDLEDLTIKNQEILNLDYDYYPYLDVDTLIEEFHQSSDKLIILHGNPGVGKSKLTSLISHKFLKEFNQNVIMFPGRYCMERDAWSVLEHEIEESSRDGKDTFVVIDDLDPAFLNRDLGVESTSNVFFNSLITLLDGVISTGVKFVISTNHVILQTDDSPLYRPGRLFDSILLRPLTSKEALALLQKYNVSKAKVREFKKLKQDEYYQSFVAQFINESNNNIKRSYYRGENKQVTTIKSNKIGFN